MISEKDEREIRYFKDDDEEEDEESLAIGSKSKAQYNKAQHVELDSKKVEEMIHQIEVLVDQLHHLYNLYFQKLEKRPPIEKRALLEHQVKLLQNAVKATPALRFRANTAQSTFLSYKDRWDRKLKELEVNMNQSLVAHAKPKVKVAKIKKRDSA